MNAKLGLILFSLMFLTPAFSAEIQCTDCHDQVMLKAFPHEAAVMSCENCHNKHPEDGPYPTDSNLKGKVEDLCLSCHEKRAIFKNCHPGADGQKKCGHPGIGHPTSGPGLKDPLYPEKDFSCVSCHNPHSAPSPKLFRYDFSANTPYQGQSCAVCHWDFAFPGEKPPTPPWN